MMEMNPGMRSSFSQKESSGWVGGGVILGFGLGN